jgi:DNA-binding XRE family transcriptional regulator
MRIPEVYRPRPAISRGEERIRTLSAMEDAKLGALLRALRIRRDWRQADLAARAEVSRSAISRIERGHFAGTTVTTLRSVALAVRS